MAASKPISWLYTKKTSLISLNNNFGTFNSCSGLFPFRHTTLSYYVREFKIQLSGEPRNHFILVLLTVLVRLIQAVVAITGTGWEVQERLFAHLPHPVSVTGGGGGKKEPPCGKGMGANACPPVDGDMWFEAAISSFLLFWMRMLWFFRFLLWSWLRSWEYCCQRVG